MPSVEKYHHLFMEVFSLQAEEVKDDLAYNTIAAWDSVGHMMLMSALESTFSIMLETEDIIDFSSVGKGKEILEKYNVIITY